MILQALANYYERLACDEGSGIARRGLSSEKISYAIVLTREGEVAQVDDIQDTTGKKPRPVMLQVPQGEKRTSGIKPNFLWDKSSYVLGVSEKTGGRVAEEHTAFVKRHVDQLEGQQDEGLKALVSFLKAWTPDKFVQPRFPAEMLDKNIIFRLEGDRAYLHERPAVAALLSRLNGPETLEEVDTTKAASSEPVMCLVSGEMAVPARIHQSIKGVDGAKPSGASIVSFNKQSFTSYNKEQGDNSPVSEASAFAYTTALNHLLRRGDDNRQRLKLGATTVVFWAEAQGNDQAAAQASEMTLSALLGATPSGGTDESETLRARAVLEHVQKGLPLQNLDPNLKSDTRMYILGLSPNAARLSIRFWLTSSFGDLLKHLAMHEADLCLNPVPWKNFPSPWRLVLATVPYREGANSEMDDAFNNQVGGLMRAMLTGSAYPRNLLANVIMRIRADGHMGGTRVALCKAVLCRERRLQQRKQLEDIPVSLDKNSTEPGYLLGRLFAVLEHAQSAALGSNVNATIRDRYYGAASATPASIFPVLLRNSANHLGKVRKERKGLAVNIEKLLQEILDKMPDHFPRSLNLEGQGRFAIGYYHQSKDHYTKRDNGEGEDQTTPAEQNSNDGDQA